MAPANGRHVSDDLAHLIAARKPGFALEIGAMGSREHNFYTQTKMF